MLKLLPIAAAALAAAILAVTTQQDNAKLEKASHYPQNGTAGAACEEEWRQLLASAEAATKDPNAFFQHVETVEPKTCPWVRELASVLLEEAKEPTQQTRKPRLVYADTQPCFNLPVSSRQTLRGPFIARVRVTREGRARDVLVEKGTGWRQLDECLLGALRKAWFRPEKRGHEFLEGDVLLMLHICPH
ncbi:hypothetical protein HRbin09_00465 [bacterium HR09]|nr:hypothetical protein HRbin09_00465 [bacterium HR09]